MTTTTDTYEFKGYGSNSPDEDPTAQLVITRPDFSGEVGGTEELLDAIEASLLTRYNVIRVEITRIDTVQTIL